MEKTQREAPQDTSDGFRVHNVVWMARWNEDETEEVVKVIV